MTSLTSPAVCVAAVLSTIIIVAWIITAGAGTFLIAIVPAVVGSLIIVRIWGRH